MAFLQPQRGPLDVRVGATASELRRAYVSAQERDQDLNAIIRSASQANLCFSPSP